VLHPPKILKPHEPVAERVLLPGDPGRALRLATALIDGPRMLNHHRGLWGYTGPAADGDSLTVQSTGLGGPSAAAVVAELAALGARRVVRVGTAAGLGATPLGALVAVTAVLAGDGASRALGGGDRIEPDAALAAALAAQPDVLAGLVASVDVHVPAREGTWGGALAADLTTAAVLVAAAREGLAAGAVLGITRAGGEHLHDDELDALERRLGSVALAALG
jgi:purine-nucleoside phosphorylase